MTTGNPWSVCTPTWHTRPSSRMASMVGAVVGGPVGVPVQRGPLRVGTVIAMLASLCRCGP